MVVSDPDDANAPSNVCPQNEDPFDESELDYVAFRNQLRSSLASAVPGKTYNPAAKTMANVVRAAI